MTKKKVVKVSDINKEIAEEMIEDRKSREIANEIEVVKSINKSNDWTPYIRLARKRRITSI